MEDFCGRPLSTAFIYSHMERTQKDVLELRSLQKFGSVTPILLGQEPNLITVSARGRREWRSGENGLRNWGVVTSSHGGPYTTFTR